MSKSKGVDELLCFYDGAEKWTKAVRGKFGSDLDVYNAQN